MLKMEGEMTVGVVDYGAGNLKSVETALEYLGASFVTSSSPDELRDSDALIVPGVGEAASAMNALTETGLDRLILDHARDGKPLLGICLGCQVFMERSEERDTRCLGILEGKVVRMPAGPALKIPHMGWNTVDVSREDPMFRGIPNESSFYFVHSYCVQIEGAEGVVGTTEHGIRFASALARDNVTAVQFHPEKSGKHGLRLLRSFLGGRR